MISDNELALISPEPQIKTPLTYIPRPLRTVIFAWGAAGISTLAVFGCTPEKPIKTFSSSNPTAEVAASTKIAPTSMPIEKPGPSLINCVGSREIPSGLTWPSIASKDDNAPCWHFRSNLMYEIDIPKGLIITGPYNPQNPINSKTHGIDFFGTQGAIGFILRNKDEIKDFDKMLASEKQDTLNGPNSVRTYLAPNTPLPVLHEQEWKERVNGRRVFERSYTIPLKDLNDQYHKPSINYEQDVNNLTIYIDAGNDQFVMQISEPTRYEELRRMAKTVKINPFS